MTPSDKPNLIATADGEPLIMVGCGILSKEVNYLIKKNGWNLQTRFLASALHNYFDRLYKELDDALTVEDAQKHKTVVFYGACHPRIGTILNNHKTLRTEGQNCIVMLLGYERFMEELGKGAYFLLEDWALTWEPMITECFGKKLSVVREIFGSSHKYLLALRTPCSGNFTEAAETAAAFVDLPLMWMDVDLSCLETVLSDLLARQSS